MEAAWGFKTSSGELLETSWRLTEPSWSLLESLGGVLGALGAVLEASWEVLGLSWRRIRGILEAPWVVLGPSWELWKPCWSHLEAKRLAENDENLIFNDGTKDFNDLPCLRAFFLC